MNKKGNTFKNYSKVQTNQGIICLMEKGQLRTCEEGQILKKGEVIVVKILSQYVKKNFFLPTLKLLSIDLS